MTRYRVRAKYAILDNLPAVPDVVLLTSDAEIADLGNRITKGEEPRPFSFEVNGTPVVQVPTGKLIYTNRVRVTTGGRPVGRDLAKRGRELLKYRQALGSLLTQEALAEKLGVQRVTVQRYFGDGHWMAFKETGALPPCSA